MSIRRAQDERLEGTPDGLNAISEIMDVPDAPTIGTATDNGNAGASVTFTAATTGGTPSTYTVTSTPGSITGTGASSPITVSGLTPNTAYTFKVKAANAGGVFGPESVASDSMTPAFPILGAYDALAHTTIIGTTANSITFAGIPQTYKHLQIRGTAPVANYVTGKLQFNGDAGSNYSRHTLLANGVNAPQATAATSATYISIAADNGFGRSSYPYSMIIDILDYTNTNKNKTVRMFAGFDTNSTDGGEVCLESGMWISTSAINTVTFGVTSGNYPANTQFALYGVN